MDKIDSMITEARTWLGTRWRHNTAIKGVGTDCIGFLYEVAKSQGILLTQKPKNYARLASYELIDFLDENFERANKLDKGVILLFKISGLSTHVALMTDTNTIIHADSIGNRGVIEHKLDGCLLNNIGGLWKCHNL